MTEHRVRGAAVAVALALLAAGCSSSHSKKVGSSTVPSSSTTSLASPSTVDSSSTTKPAPPTTAKGGTGATATTRPVTLPSTTVPPPPVTTTVTTPLTVSPSNTRWELAVDYRTHPNENPFASYLGGPRVWTLRESQSLAHDGNYPLLPAYASTFGTPGIVAWHGNSPVCGGQGPVIGAETTDASGSACNATIPGDAAFVYPDATHMAVIGWSSPFTGQARIMSGVADLDGNCGDGVSYYIDRGTTQLSDIRLINRNSVELQPITTHVVIGQSLYFIVDAGPVGDTGCDTTQLEITIDHLP